MAVSRAASGLGVWKRRPWVGVSDIAINQAPSLSALDVRSSLNSGKKADIAACLRWAISRLMHCSEESLFDQLVSPP
jgi:hypothetical protein